MKSITIELTDEIHEGIVGIAADCGMTVEAVADGFFITGARILTSQHKAAILVLIQNDTPIPPPPVKA